MSLLLVHGPTQDVQATFTIGVDYVAWVPIADKECPRNQKTGQICGGHGICREDGITAQATAASAANTAAVVDVAGHTRAKGGGLAASVLHAPFVATPHVGESLCRCNPGWAGDNCTVCAPGYWTSNYRACVACPGLGPGAAELDNEDNEDNEGGMYNCTGHGVCSNATKGKCVCDDGWNGTACQTCGLCNAVGRPGHTGKCILPNSTQSTSTSVFSSVTVPLTEKTENMTCQCNLNWKVAPPRGRCSVCSEGYVAKRRTYTNIHEHTRDEHTIYQCLSCPPNLRPYPGCLSSQH